MSPEYVRPYVKAQKNDDRDAEGIAEAASRPTMRFVELKSQEQLDIQTLHRVRSRWVAERTTLINQLRAVLLKRGVVFAVGRMKFESALNASPKLTRSCLRASAAWSSIPGIGVLNATALVAAIGDASSFKHARDQGAWLGLVPRQFTTGGKARLLGITKRGNTYLRTLLVQGARAAMRTLSQSDTPIGQWLQAMLSRGVERNVEIVALANKLARSAWAVLRKGQPYERAHGIAVI